MVDKGCCMAGLLAAGVVLRSLRLELPAIHSPSESMGPTAKLISGSSTLTQPSGYRQTERCSMIVTAAEESTAPALLAVGCQFAGMKGTG